MNPLFLAACLLTAGACHAATPDTTITTNQSAKTAKFDTLRVTHYGQRINNYTVTHHVTQYLLVARVDGEVRIWDDRHRQITKPIVLY
jgi:hypothetical protein